MAAAQVGGLGYPRAVLAMRGRLGEDGITQTSQLPVLERRLTQHLHLGRRVGRRSQWRAGPTQPEDHEVHGGRKNVVVHRGEGDVGQADDVVPSFRRA
jgi:hypothetical protein